MLWVTVEWNIPDRGACSMWTCVWVFIALRGISSENVFFIITRARSSVLLLQLSPFLFLGLSTDRISQQILSLLIQGTNECPAILDEETRKLTSFQLLWRVRCLPHMLVPCLYYLSCLSDDMLTQEEQRNLTYKYSSFLRRVNAVVNKVLYGVASPAVT